MANADGIQRPFSDRVADAAEKTAGSVLFDVRIDDDASIQRMAAIGYGDPEAAIVVLEKSGQLRCADWDSSPLSEHVRYDDHGTAMILLAKLRRSGHLK